MKKLAFLFILALGSIAASSQVVWNKRLPVTPVLPNFSKLAYTENSNWVSSDGTLLQISNTGDIVGQLKVNFGTSYLRVWGAKIANPTTASPSFLLARLTSTTGNGYAIAYVQPDLGIVNQSTFADSLSSATQSKGPVFVVTDDSTLFVFGHKFIRKIRHSTDGSITEAWAKLLLFKTTNALWTGNQAIFCDAMGNFKAIDANGNLLWEKTQAFNTKSIKLLPNGIIGCGMAPTGEGLIFKLDFNGNLLWSKLLAGQKTNALTSVVDGGIILTGESDSLNWLVTKTDGAGNTLWTKTYEKGKGLEVVPSPEGGAVVLWLSTGTYRLRLAKIDALGNTVSADPERSQIAERTLYTSGAKATQFPLEGLFFDGSSSRLMVPADGAASPIFINSPWISGSDAAGNLHIAATTYDNQIADYRAGLASSPAKDFERVWAVSREEIASIRRDFGEDGDLDSPPPFDLLTWPAKGNTNFHQNLDFSLVTTNPDSLPAPFVDQNGDGVYHVFDGDYPKLLGDRMLWWARTDQTVHEETNGQPLGIDVYFTLYGYNCPQNGGISQSVFADYQIINRSGEAYSNAYMGFFTDFDLGCSDDDYIGSIPDANSFYVYNQDAVDGQPGSTCAGGTATYGENVPIESITMLNHKLDHAIYYDRGGSPSDPSTPTEYAYYLQGLMCSGQLPTVGGTGCNPGSTDFTNYVFTDNPASPAGPTGWTMCTSNLPLGDRRMVTSHGPFDFAAGDTFAMRLAFIFHPDVPHPCPDVFGLVKPTILQIQQWHDEGTLDDHLDLGSVLTLVPGQSLILNATQANPATNYAWSTGQNTPGITVNQLGEYSVTVTPATGCAYSESVLVKSASGTSSPTLLTWQLQPNPASNAFKIVFENAKTPVTAVLRNAQGRLVATKSSSESSLEISVANLPTGLYWAELWHDGAFLGSRKVVVAR